MLIDLSLIVITAALVVIALTAILNAFTFPRLREPTRSRLVRFADATVEKGHVSRVFVLIPARNEAGVIANTVKSLLAQAYPALNVIVLDDGSDDGTGDLARAAAAGDVRLRVLSGSALMEGWLGKNWACHQLAQSALGEASDPDDVLIFTDADVTWRPGALAALIDEITRNQVDLLTVWSTQITRTWGERLVVPLMALVILGYLPSPLVNRTPWTAFAAANGQCLAFRRRAYQAVGGHAAVRDRIVEDITFARRIKAKKMRLWMADGAGLIVCRMYTSWSQVRDGYAKNIVAGYGSVAGLIAGAIFHWLVFLMPLILLTVALLIPDLLLNRVWLFALTALGIGVRALTAAVTRQRIIDALWMPVSVILMTRIAAQALYWQARYGGVRWKGRVIRNRSFTA